MNGLIGYKLKAQNPPTKSISFARQEELHEECLGAIIPSIHCTLVSIEPLLRSPQKIKQKQTKQDRVLRHSLDHKSTAKL